MAAVAFPQFSAALPDLAEGGGEMFASPAWFATLADHGFDPEVQRCYLTRETPVGRVALPLVDGPQLTALSNFYSSLYQACGPVDALSPDDWQAIARALHAHPRRWPVICLQPLDTEGALYRGLPSALQVAGYWVDDFFCFGNWTLAVAGRDFATYFAGLPGALQNTIKRARKKLAREAEWRIEIVQASGDALERALAHYADIYAASWKPDEAFPEFIPHWCRVAATRGWLRLGLLYLGETAVAAQLWFVVGGKASIFKLAYREGFERFSPGSVLTSELMQQAIDVDRVSEVDYLTGDDAYKRDWMSHRRERRGLVAFRRDTPAAWLAAARHFSGNLWRTLRNG